MIQYELKVLPGLQTLRKLDLRGNTVGSLRELAVLAGLPDLRDLQLDGGSPGNSICAVPGYRYKLMYCSDVTARSMCVRGATRSAVGENLLATCILLKHRCGR